MKREGAEREWIRRGNAIRNMTGLPRADFGLLPSGRAVAFMPAGLPDADREAEMRRILGRWEELHRAGRDDVAAVG